MSRTLADLKSNAKLYWPREINQSIDSSLPLLLLSQDKFLSLLASADSDPFAWAEALSSSSMSANLFLKHLMIFTDIGGERLQRFSSSFSQLFPNQDFSFEWRGEEFKYRFSSSKPRWTNKALGVTDSGLKSPSTLTDEINDVANLMLHAGLATDPPVPEEIKEKCIVGALIGFRSELDHEAKQKYLYVSRQSGGANANARGYAAENYVKNFLRTRLKEWDFSSSSIPGISQNLGVTDTSFDIVSKSPKGQYCAIEVSFQVTTNSTIERKSGQAVDRRAVLKGSGHKIAYVLDGAGNFNRATALRNIVSNSDCAVTFADHELEKLVMFIRGLG